MKKPAKAAKRGRPNTKGRSRRLSCRLSETAAADLEAIRKEHSLTLTAAIERALAHYAPR